MNINKRKKEHLEIVSQDASDLSIGGNAFSSLKLNYMSLPEVDLSKVSSETEFLGKTLSFPFYISPMTGGADEAKSVNEILAVAANQTGVGMGLGSMRAYLEDESLFDTFNVRDLAAQVPLIGNIGLVQMNYGVSIDDIKRLIDLFGLDAMSVHLNPLQEALQPEGDVSFVGLLDKLQSLIKALDVPVIVKDVGMGISSDVMSDLVEVGAEYVDVSGHGGTSWSYIEGQRGSMSLADPFVEEGFNTVDLLFDNVLEFPEVSFISGGGLRSGVDVFKSVALGAVVGNSARPFALAAMKSLEDVVNLIEEWKKQFQISMFVTGVSEIDSVVGNRSLLQKKNV
jgi:isopentenyl-diphosphate delta-isomerase